MYSQKGGGSGVMNGKPGESKDEPLVAGSPPGDDELITEDEHVPFLMRYITLISRLFGVITVTVLWSLAVLTLSELSKYNSYAPWYLLAIALLTTFFELIWLFNKCATCRKNNCCCRCWRLMVWIDNWRKAVLYVVFGVPMFIRGLVTVYTVICGLLLLILGVLYFIKSFKESKCIARKPRKHSYVQTSSVPKPKYVEHPVQTQAGDYPPASHGYNSLGHTNSIQPPGYTARPEQPTAQGQETNYFRPFKDGMGNVQDDPSGTTLQQPQQRPQTDESPADSRRKSQKPKHPVSEQKQMAERTPSIESQKSKSDATKDEKSSPKEAREKAKSSPTDEGGFKLFGLLKKEEKPKEQVVTMVSSERSVDEDLEHYPDDKNPFDDDEDCEWDPNNRGQH